MMRFTKPWGSYVEHMRGRNCVFKTLHVEPGQQISIQKHFYRSEFWYVQMGSGIIYLDDTARELKTGQTVTIPVGRVHGVKNTGEVDLVIQEMQWGDDCREDDIVRYYDVYGRIVNEAGDERRILDLEKCSPKT